MTAKDLLIRIKKHPFSPFRVIVSDGATYDVCHPDQIMVGRDSVTIGIRGESEELFEAMDLVDLNQVVRLEPLPAKAKSK